MLKGQAFILSMNVVAGGETVTTSKEQVQQGG